MKKKIVVRVVVPLFIAVSSLFFVSVAMAGVTENECVNGGGTVAAGSGCRFCTGGKYDLSEIREAGKNNVSRQETGRREGDQARDESRSGPRDEK